MKIHNIQMVSKIAKHTLKFKVQTKLFGKVFDKFDKKVEPDATPPGIFKQIKMPCFSHFLFLGNVTFH